VISIEQLSQVYAEKLIQTGDHQAAFRKAVWVAYKQGVADEHVGLPQTSEPGGVVAGSSRAVDRELEAEELHQAVCPELPSVGMQEGFKPGQIVMLDPDTYDRHPAQLRPHHTPDAPIRLRFDRTTKLTRRAVQDKPKQG